MGRDARVFRWRLAGGVAAACLITAGPALAESDPDLEARVRTLSERIEAQERIIAAQAAELEVQRRALAEQGAEIARQGDELRNLPVARREDLEVARGAGYGTADLSSFLQNQSAAPSPGGASASAAAAPPTAPVGEAPPAEPPHAEVAAIPPEASVLTPKGHLLFESDLDYTLTNSNILVFRGVEIIPGVQLGLIEASNTSDAFESYTGDFRYGLFNRFELELRVPYVWRQDRINVTQQEQGQVTLVDELSATNIGDVEISARYQLNKIQPDFPIFIGGLRVKTNTGTSPFTIPRDQFGVEERLATGSGYWIVEPNLAFIYPSDPVVLFGTLSYDFGVTQPIHRVVDTVLVNKVIPGDTIGASLGFGFAINSRFSFSAAYKYYYFYPTAIKLGGGDGKEVSQELQVGTAVLGLAYRLTDRISLAASFEFGTTADAPNNHITLRLPILF